MKYVQVYVVYGGLGHRLWVEVDSQGGVYLTSIREAATLLTLQKAQEVRNLLWQRTPNLIRSVGAFGIPRPHEAVPARWRKLLGIERAMTHEGPILAPGDTPRWS